MTNTDSPLDIAKAILSMGLHDYGGYTDDDEEIESMAINIIELYCHKQVIEAYKKGYIDGQIGAANGYDNQGNPIKYGVV